MGVAESITRGRSVTIELIALVLLGLVGVGLFVDLLVRLFVLSPSTQGSVAISSFATLLLDGLVLGLIYGLAGVGLSMTYSILNFANFSHGDLITSGAFFGWVTTWLLTGLGTASAGTLFLLGTGGPVTVGDLDISIVKTPLAILLGMVVAAVGTLLLSLLIDRSVYKRMRNQSGIALLIASIGVALALRYLIAFVWQTGSLSATAVNDVESTAIFLVDGTINVDVHEVTLIVAAIGLMLGVHVLLQRTKLGKAMRAMADNEDLARVTGIPTERIITYTWAIGGGLAGISGYLIALNTGVLRFNLGWTLLLLIFAAVILGGIGSIYGAMGGGLVIGLAEQLSLVWIPSEFTTVAAFGVMILVLLFKPSGLFSGVTVA
jgi:branched-chain amino acid transport system permease protein